MPEVGAGEGVGSRAGSAGGCDGSGVLRGTSWARGASSASRDARSVMENPGGPQRLPMRQRTTFTVSTRMERSKSSEKRLM
jgi:hypothetical protein